MLFAESGILAISRGLKGINAKLGEGERGMEKSTRMFDK